MQNTYPKEIEIFIENLTAWRKARKYSKEPIPLSFLEDLIILQRKYPNEKLQQVCKIAASTMQRYTKNNVTVSSKTKIIRPETLPSTIIPKLVELPKNNEKVGAMQKCILELEVVSGLKIRIFQ